MEAYHKRDTWQTRFYDILNLNTQKDDEETESTH